MQVLTDLFNFIVSNLQGILAGGFGTLGVFFLGFVLKLFLNSVQLKKAPEKFLYNKFYDLGSLVKEHLVDNIKDVTSREKMKKYLDKAGNSADRGWDDSLYDREKKYE